jgi:peptidoglycan/xylan/chitin deacetylase (PgdA/CDA1 family)
VAALLVGLYVAWRIAVGYPPRGAAQVLCFHKISRRFLWEGTWTTPERFFGIVDHLLERGHRFVGQDEYLARLDTAQAADPAPLFLTFDDGYAGLLADVLDGLIRRSVPLHVFVVSDFAGRTNRWDLSLGRPAARHADWEELRELAAAGVTFGSHTATHRDLTRLDDDAVAAELVRSRQVIAEKLDTVVRTLSYPFGRYNAAARAAAQSAGYEAAFSLYPRHRNERIDRWALRRNGVYIIDTPRTVARRLRRHPWFWFEEMKCRAINGVAVLTPLLRNRQRREPSVAEPG